MFITEKKRAVYDENGAIYKIDILRSIRRKDAPQSTMKAIEDQEGGKAVVEDKSIKYRRVVQLLLVAIMVFTCYVLISRLIKTHQNELQQGMPFEHFASQPQTKPLKFNEVVSSFKEGMNIQDSKEIFLTQSQCQIAQGGILQCKLDLAKIGFKK